MSLRPTPECLDAFVHGLLDSAEAAEVERNLTESEEWRDALDSARRRRAALDALARSEASEGLVQRTLRGIDERAVRRRRRVRGYFGTVLVAAAVCVAVLVGMQAHYRGLSATPVDLQAFGQNALLAGSNASLRVALRHANTHAPLAGVPVRMVLVNTVSKEEVRLADFSTDPRGSASPRFTLPDWESGVYTLKVVARTDSGDEELSRPVTLKRESKLMLSSDKPLYQPGQTIHLRALALRRPDLKPVGDGRATFAISDPQGNVIFRQSGATSRFGIASADCPLATEILEGTYQITCRVSDTESQLSVQVEKYVLPKFKAAVSLDRPYYQPGETVKGTIQAEYFFGKPVVGGEVRLIAQTTDIGVTDIHEEALTTDATGKAEFEFRLPVSFVGREQHGGDARFQVAATVTDTAGQKHAVAESRTVTENPLRVEVLPESGTLVKGVLNTIYVLATYVDGRPVKGVVRVNQDPPFETNSLGVGSFELTPESNEVGLTVAALDHNGQQGRKHVKLACGQLADDFLVRTDKASYRGGETVTVTAFGGGVQPVFVDILKEKQTLLTQMVDVKEGQGETAIDLPPDVFGTLQLYVYRFAANGLPVMKTRTIYVEPPGGLKIAVERDADVYRPGGNATLKFTLTDEAGQPTPGALSVAAVDEAVFHVLRQRPGLEGTFFNLEQELLAPVYAIYPWSPFAFGAPADQDQLAQRLELERALFSRTARSVGTTSIQSVDAGGAPGMEGGDWPVAMMDAPFLVERLPGPAVEVAAIDEPGFGPADSPAVDLSQPVASPLTLAVTTYPAKVERVLRERSTGIDLVRRGWTWLVGLTVLALLAGFAAFKPKMFLITAGATLGLAVVGTGVLFAVMAASPEAKWAVAKAARGIPGGAVMLDEVGAMDWGGMAPLSEAAMAPGGEFLGGIGAAAGEDAGAAATPVRVRRQFPETLLWQPQLITDDEGRATLEIPLADSITNWRLSASAVSARGQLGALQDGVRVFQPFFVDLNLPVALIRNDEVAIPVVVYNYLAEPQTVEIVVERDEWFEILDGPGGASGPEDDGPAVAEIPGRVEATPRAAMRVALGPSEIRSLSVRIRAVQVGLHSLQATARSLTQPGVADALRRDIAVEPNGTKVEVVHNGSLAEPVELTFAVPDEAIPGSVKALVKLYPSSFSQLVEGLDAIFQRPYGCFEQTSSTTYPNILALDYLRQTKKSVPEVEAKARQYIHLGYQRLLGFEVTHDGVRGGFDWFGNPPANQTLSAYGLLEFTDMAKVHDVDANLIERTRQWLLGRRQADGSWRADIGMLNDGLAGSIQRGKDLDLATTAYVAWGVFGSGGAKPQAALTLDYLLAHSPSSIESPYVLAMVANAVAAIEPQNAALKPYVARLDGLKKTDESGKKAWWELPQEAQTCFYGSGESGKIEVTALASLALLESQQFPATAKRALTWLVEQKDAQGTWHSTQATILALKALIRGTAAPLGGEKPRIIEVAVDGETVETLTIAADQADVMQQLNLSARFATGTHRLTLTEKSDSGTGFQATFRHHVPSTPLDAAASEPLQVAIVYDKTTLAVNDQATATATVTNRMEVEAPMVILDLPIPAGFRIATDDLDELVSGGKIAKFQQNARSAVVYLRTLKSGETLTLSYRLEATMPVKLTVPPAVVYEYYNPAKRGTGNPIELVVNPRPL